MKQLDQLVLLKEYHFADPVIILNVGLHLLTGLNWDEQKNFFDGMYNQVKSKKSTNTATTVSLILSSFLLLEF